MRSNSAGNGFHEMQVSVRKQIVLSLLSVVAGVGLLVGLAYQLSLPSVIDQFQDIGWHYVVAALLFGLGATPFRVARYCLFFPFKAKLALLYVTFVYMRAINYALPFRLGEPVSLYLLKRFGLVPTISSAAPAWTLFRLGDVLALLLLLLPAMVFMLPNEAHANGWLAGVAAMIFIGLVMLGTWRYWAELLSHLMARHTGRLSNIFHELRRGFSTTTSHLRITLSVAASLLIVASNVLACVFALWALDLPISLAEAIAVTVVALGTNSLPFRPPLGIGLSESVWTGLLVLAGLSADQAFAGALAVRFAQLATIILETTAAAVANSLLYGGSRRSIWPRRKPTIGG